MPRMMDGISGYGRYANANGASSETSRGAGRPSACSKGVKLTRSPLCTVHFGAKQPRGVFPPSAKPNHNTSEETRRASLFDVV